MKVSLDGSVVKTGFAVGDVFIGIENLTGSGFADTLVGNGAANGIYGNDGSDTINGRAGNDVLRGGKDRDVLTGGGGIDRFHFEALSEAGDVITDFAADDFIQLRAAAFGGLPTGALNPGRFHSGPGNVANDADCRLVFRTTDKTLWFDSNGDLGGGTLLKIATFSNGYSITAADILIV